MMGFAALNPLMVCPCPAHQLLIKINHALDRFSQLLYEPNIRALIVEPHSRELASSRYPLATSLNCRNISMWPSKSQMRYMGYNITMSAPSRRQPSAAL